MVRGTRNYVWNKEDRIGEGTFSVVFKGRHRKGRTEVAVKVCTLSKCRTYDERKYMEDISILQRFNSPYITKYLTKEKVEGSAKEKYAIIMELAEGSLRSELAKEENLLGIPKEMLLILIDNCVRALEYLDKERLCHRDMKPENILVFYQPELTFKLCDFGLSLALAKRDDSMHTLLGTRCYMPTSMIKQIASDSPVRYSKDQYDIWATACCFFEGATGQRPFLTRKDSTRSQEYELVDLFKNRPSDMVWAQYSEDEEKYQYEKRLPEQHESYSSGFRSILSKYFQLMFNRNKKFLNIGRFSALSREMISIKEYRYYCLNSLTEETFCDTEQSIHFPRTSLRRTVKTAIRNAFVGLTVPMPVDIDDILNLFLNETDEIKLSQTGYREPFAVVLIPSKLFSGHPHPKQVATLYNTDNALRLEIQTSDGIKAIDKNNYSLQLLAKEALKPTRYCLSHYLRRYALMETGIPEPSYSASLSFSPQEEARSYHSLRKFSLETSSSQGMRDGEPVVPVYDEEITLYDDDNVSDCYANADFSFKTDDIMTVVDSSNSEWWKVSHPGAGTGFVPRKLVATSSEVLQAGPRSRNGAAYPTLKKSLSEDTFSIREGAPGIYERLLAQTVCDADSGSTKYYSLQHKTDGNGGRLVAVKQVFPGPHGHAHYSEVADEVLTTNLSRTASMDPDVLYGTQVWEMPRSELKLERKVGSGSFGEVWYGRWRGIHEVAVKKLKPATTTAETFLEEAQIVKQCNHPKLVKLYGICAKEEPLYVITEFMCNGSLLNFLREEIVTLQAIIGICSQVADGMKYLERRKLVHRDLAARNVLVGEEVSGTPVVKVADFGLARPLLGDAPYVSRSQLFKFPVKWTAPEAAICGSFTSASDVWSYGILLYEIVTKGRAPYPEMNNREVLEKVKRGYRMPSPKGCPVGIYQTMLKCWNKDPYERPTFKHLCCFFDDYYVSSQPSELSNTEDENSAEMSYNSTNALPLPKSEDLATDMTNQKLSSLLNLDTDVSFV